MKRFTIIVGMFTVLFAGCGGDGENGNPDCPDMSGMWSFGYQCPNSSSGRGAEVTQDGCDITSVWKDDNTPHEDILTGTVDKDGTTMVTIDFGDSSVTCTGVFRGSDCTSDCTPGDCQLVGEKL